MDLKNKHVDVVYVDTSTVFCDGENETSGHPRVYFELSANTAFPCPYCSQVYCWAKSPISLS